MTINIFLKINYIFLGKQYSKQNHISTQVTTHIGHSCCITYNNNYDTHITTNMRQTFSQKLITTMMNYYEGNDMTTRLETYITT
jgi:hypothetical protein